jgi:hypothetical protein
MNYEFLFFVRKCSVHEGEVPSRGCQEYWVGAQDGAILRVRLRRLHDRRHATGETNLRVRLRSEPIRECLNARRDPRYPSR